MRQGEIWLINLDPTVGSEIQKKRPAIIINDDRLGVLPLKVIVPITDWKNNYSIANWMVQISPTSENGLTKLSAIDCFQIRSLSEERFIKKLGVISDNNLVAIKIALKKVLSIS